jgi:hypothetical protein
MTTYAERITALENSRGAKLAAMDEVMKLADDENRTLDESEQETFDGLEREVEAIDDQLKRYRVLHEKMATSKPIVPQNTKTIEDGSAQRGHNPRVTVTEPKVGPGIRFARMVKCLGVAQGNRAEAARIAETRYSNDPVLVATLKAAANMGEVSDLVVKVAVSGGTTLDPVWAGPLVSADSGVFADFVEFLRPQTILGRFGTGGIPALRQVPFRTGLIGQTTGGAGYWVGEGDAKPLTKFDFSRTTLTPLKVANIAVITEELLRDSSPSADVLVRDSLAAALRERLDRDFIDPAKAAVANVSPASITNGITPIQSTGATAAQVRADIRAVMANFIAANNPPTSGVWIMRSTTALALGMMTNTISGDLEFPTVSMNGGTLAGLPIITSEFVPASGSPTGDYVVLVNASDIYFADDGGISVDMSREASLQMDDTTTMTVGGGDTASPSEASTGTSVVSLWQTNSVGFRAERTLNWARRRPSGVQVVWGVNWGE